MIFHKVHLKDSILLHSLYAWKDLLLEFSLKFKLGLGWFANLMVFWTLHSFNLVSCQAKTVILRRVNGIKHNQAQRHPFFRLLGTKNTNLTIQAPWIVAKLCFRFLNQQKNDPQVWLGCKISSYCCLNSITSTCHHFRQQRLWAVINHDSEWKLLTLRSLRAMGG